jgi:hypothetical protein
MFADALAQVSRERLRRDVFRLAKDPLPFRKVNYTVPGHATCSLDETDDLIAAELEAAGLPVVRTPYQVQAFRCDETKPLHHWYSAPAPEDPWYTACNVEATKLGTELPDEFIQLVSHKDSMSWIDSPGAHDNCTGTVANLELARILAGIPTRRTIRILFCNEEHTPWTSRFRAAESAKNGDRIVAVLNQDSIAGKPDEAREAGLLTHAAAYSTDEGKEIAELEARLNDELGLGLELNVFFKEHVNDDDGMFIKEGFRRTVMNVGSCPYKDSQYHLVGDVPERVDIENVYRSTQLVLATVLALDAED